MDVGRTIAKALGHDLVHELDDRSVTRQIVEDDLIVGCRRPDLLHVLIAVAQHPVVGVERHGHLARRSEEDVDRIDGQVLERPHRLEVGRICERHIEHTVGQSQRNDTEPPGDRLGDDRQRLRGGPLPPEVDRGEPELGGQCLGERVRVDDALIDEDRPELTARGSLEVEGDGKFLRGERLGRHQDVSESSPGFRHRHRRDRCGGHLDWGKLKRSTPKPEPSEPSLVITPTARVSPAPTFRFDVSGTPLPRGYAVT